MSIQSRTGWQPTTPATTSRSGTISSALVLRMGFVVLPKTIHFSRVRWLFQPPTPTCKETWYAKSAIHHQFHFGRFFHRRIGAGLSTHGAVSLTGHHSDPRQVEIHNPYRTTHDRKDHGSCNWRQGLLDCGCGWQLLFCASGETRHQLQLEPHYGQGKHLQFHPPRHLGLARDRPRPKGDRRTR